MKILLIDDEAYIGRINRDLLIQEGMAPDDVSAVDSGAAALAHLAEGQEAGDDPPDVILLDIYMPSMNGWEFLDEFERSAFAFRDKVQVFILSGSTAARDVEHSATRSEVKGFFRKPLDRETAHEVMSAGTLARRAK